MADINFSGFANAALQMGAETMLLRPVKRGLVNIKNPDGTTMDDIVAMVTIEERHSDELEITDHPVQQGASIADHAFKLPAEITITMAWSNSPNKGAGVLGLATAAVASALPVGVTNAISGVASLVNTAKSVLSGQSTSDTMNETYSKLLTLQSNRALFDIYTARRTYYNMVCKSLSVVTDEKTANALFVTMTAKQVIIVGSQTVLLPAANTKDAPRNATPIDKGIQPTMVSQTISASTVAAATTQKAQ